MKDEFSTLGHTILKGRHTPKKSSNSSPKPLNYTRTRVNVFEPRLAPRGVLDEDFADQLSQLIVRAALVRGAPDFCSLVATHEFLKIIVCELETAEPFGFNIVTQA